MPSCLVDIIVGVYSHLVWNMAHILQLTLGLLDTLDRASIDVGDREVEFLYIIATGRKRQEPLPILKKLYRRIVRSAQLCLRALKLLDGSQRRIGELDEDQLLVLIVQAALL